MIAYRSVPKSDTRGAAFTRVRRKSSKPFQNRSRNWAVQKSEPEIGPVPVRTDKQVKLRSTFWTCLVSTGEAKLVSMTT